MKLDIKGARDFFAGTRLENEESDEEGGSESDHVGYLRGRLKLLLVVFLFCEEDEL